MSAQVFGDAAGRASEEAHGHPTRLADFFDHGVFDFDALIRSAPAVTEAARSAPTLYELDPHQMLLNAFRGALDTLVAETMARAWLGLEELRVAALASRTRGLHAAPLHRHSIASDHAPQLEIFRGPERIGSIAMSVRIEFAVEAMEVLLDRGSIVGLQAGRYAGAGTAVVGGFRVAEVSAARFAIQGAHFLPHPLAAPGPESR